MTRWTREIGRGRLTVQTLSSSPSKIFLRTRLRLSIHSTRVCGLTAGQANHANASKSLGAFKLKQRKACHLIRWRSCSILPANTDLIWRKLSVELRFRPISHRAQLRPTRPVGRCLRSCHAPLKAYRTNGLLSTFHLVRYPKRRQLRIWSLHGLDHAMTCSPG